MKRILATIVVAPVIAAIIMIVVAMMAIYIAAIILQTVAAVLCSLIGRDDLARSAIEGMQDLTSKLEAWCDRGGDK